MRKPLATYRGWLSFIVYCGDAALVGFTVYAVIADEEKLAGNVMECYP